MAITMDRWLTVLPDPTVMARYQVGVYGAGVTESSAHQEALHAPTSTPLINPATGQMEILKPIAAAASTVIEVWVEKLEPRLGEDFGWLRVLNAQVNRQKITVGTWPQLWQGEVVLPEPPSTDNRYRLVIAEYEEYLIDDEQPYDKVPTQKGRRMVFVEHVELK